MIIMRRAPYRSPRIEAIRRCRAGRYGAGHSPPECAQRLGVRVAAATTGAFRLGQTPAGSWRCRSKQVARTFGSEVRGSSVVITLTVSHSTAVSRLRRLFLSNRCFFITVRLLKERAKLAEADFSLLPLAHNRSRVVHRFYLTAWVFLPDHWHLICAPAYPVTISLVMKSIKTGSMILINRRRGEGGELWQARFFDRALRTVKEYNEKVEYTHLNPVKAGLVHRAQDWRWPSVHEYSGVSAGEQKRRCALTIDRVRMPSDQTARI